MKTRYALSIVAALAACSDDPVNFSDKVGIELKAKSDDTQNGVVTSDKSITTESGNPYGAFVAEAERQIGGAPGVIEVDSAELLLGGGSQGVATLGEIFNGKVELLFQMNDTNNTFPVASANIDAAAGGGPISLDATFSSSSVGDEDFEKLLNGSFKVVLRGPAAVGFMTKGADADVQATFTFAAFE